MPADQLTFVPTGRLFFGDNLEVLRRHLADESVDLVYLDPPFKSNKTYNILFEQKDGRKAAGQVKAFDDTWEWTQESARVYAGVVSGGGDLSRALRAFHDLLGPTDMLAYLTMMAPRLLELHRVIRRTGSLFLHCDPTASHYLKILLDAVFGPKNFRNEVAWCYTGPSSPRQRQFSRKHDIILWYSKSGTWTFNADDVRLPYSSKTQQNYKSGLVGSGFVAGDDEAARVIHQGGKIPEDYWNIAIAPRGKEYLGYPTQKPIALLERIIKAASNPGETILDPFCGCGTAIDAAQGLGRNWIGIDITKIAIDVIRGRMAKEHHHVDYTLFGEPATLDEAYALADLDKWEFQAWVCRRIGVPNPSNKKGADGNIDGRLVGVYENGDSWEGIVQAKGGRVTVKHVRELHGTVAREDADFGVLVSLYPFTAPMRREAADFGFTPEGVPRLQLITVEDVFAGAMPKLPLASSRPTSASKGAQQLRAV